MKTLEEKLNLLKSNTRSRSVRIMILGLGSVGLYLLDYLLSAGDPKLEIYVGAMEKKWRLM